MRIKIAWIGKAKHAATRDLTEHYLRQMQAFRRYATVEGVELPDKDPVRGLGQKSSGQRLWLLDPAGRHLDSTGFAAWLEREGSGQGDVVLVIGGADGFPAEIAELAAGRISLSPLTFSHELARVVAFEQVYRALAILNHHPYPR
ncbi:MAG: 23S rRNA (pseudouridine(1915)-N(3))-methyltransferase RlmH [Terriglobales bacterium]